MNFFSLLYILLTVVIFAWLQFHVPNFDDWRPQTFAQSMGILFGGLAWFFGLMATHEVFWLYDSVRLYRRRRKIRRRKS